MESYLHQIFELLTSEPFLEFEKFTKTDSQLEPIYLVRVRNIEGEGKAKNCIGKIDIGSSHSQTVFATQSDKCDILRKSHEDLRLFNIEYEKTTSPIQEKIVPKNNMYSYAQTRKLKKSRTNMMKVENHLKIIEIRKLQFM